MYEALTRAFLSNGDKAGALYILEHAHANKAGMDFTKAMHFFTNLVQPNVRQTYITLAKILFFASSFISAC